MIIGALQMDIVKNNKEENLAKVHKYVKNQNIDLVVLPELFSTGYFYETKEEIEAIAEEVPNGHTTQKLIELSKELNTHIIGTIVEKENDYLFITAVVVSPDGYLGKHRKRHLTKGEVGIYNYGTSSEIYTINGVKVGIMVCFEGWFPESARELMIKGAQILCHSALITSEKTFDIMRIRAIENKAYLVMSNAISSEMFKGKAITFRGNSRVIDFNGNILVDGGKEEKLVITEVDPSITIKKDLEDCDDIIFEYNKHK